MPLTPSQILSANRRIFGGGGVGAFSAFASSSAPRSDPVEELLDEEAHPDSEKDSPSLLERAKGAVGDIIQPVGSALDAARAATLATTTEITEALRQAAGKDILQGEHAGFSLDDLRANFNRRVGVGDVLEENTLTTGLPMNVKRGLALAGDIAIDPLNAVTLGSGTVAKKGLSRLAAAAGDDVAEVAAREGLDAADNLLARKFADEQAQAAADLAQREANFAEAAAKRADTFNDEAVLRLGDPDAALVPPDVSPVLRPAILDQPVPTVRGILSEGVPARGAERAAEAITRRGRGGIAFGGRTLVPGSTLQPLGTPFRAAGAKFVNTEAGDALRKAFIPLAETKDKFGKTIAEAMPSIVHRRAALVDRWKADLDNQLRPLVNAAIDTPEIDAVRAALDVGGSVDEALVLLADNPQAVELLTVLSRGRDRAYETLIRAGKKPEDLISKEEYLRHVLTKDGMEALGIKRTGRQVAGTKSGRMKARSADRFDKSVDELIEMDGVASYVDDPTKLVRSSFHYAQEVGGNAMAAEALEDLVKRTKNLPNGLKPSDIIRHSSAEGFTEMAPGKWVNSDLYNDVFNLAKAGTQNSIVRAWDSFSSIVKRQTLFNPVAFGPYFTQNMATGIGMNAVDGVRFSDYAVTARLHRAAHQAVKDGGEEGFDTALARLVPDPAERMYVKELRDEGTFGVGMSLYDDVAEAGPVRGLKPRKWLTPALGTHNTVKVNQWGEEMLRGSAYIRHRLQGMGADEAAALVRQRHLDYTAIGRTAFERNVINRFIFFPTWLMRAPSAIVRAYAQSPGMLNAQARVEMGTHWYDRERNDYGEQIGPRLSGPLSFLTGLGYDVLDEPVEMLNPLAKAIVDKESRDPAEMIPPLSNVMAKPGGTPGGRVGGIRTNDEKRSRYLRSLLGVRTGVDYGEERGAEQLAEKIAELEAEVVDGKTRAERGLPALTPTIRLKQAAVEAGVEDPYRITSGELVRRLLEIGVPRTEIRSILEGR